MAKKLEVVLESREERLGLWLSENARQLLIGMGMVLGLIVIAYVWHLSSQGKAESDYLTAENAFQELEKMQPGEGSPSENPNYLKLKEIIGRHPELESRYGGSLAQMFLRFGDPKLAVTYADKALKQLSTEHLPFYEEFSKTSLLIAEGNYRDAYKRASFLQQRMNEQVGKTNSGFRPTLLIVNQIRLASLLQRLNLSGEERAAWQEVDRLAKSNALVNVLEKIRTGQITFYQYMQQRISAAPAARI